MTIDNGCVLVVDDDQNVSRALRRVLRRDFATVLTANTPDAAESLLESHGVTHLVCDFDLGPKWDTGAQLISRWRRRFPGIRRALLFTGSPTGGLKKSPDIDRVISKSSTLDLLRSELGVTIH